MKLTPEREPPLCKGRGDRLSGGGIVTNCLNCSICDCLRVYYLTIPQSLRDSSLYTREPFVLVLNTPINSNLSLS